MGKLQNTKQDRNDHHRNAVSWSAESRTLVRRVSGSIVIVLVGTADPDTLRSDSDSQRHRLL